MTRTGPKKYARSLFIFRRDLRVVDNRGLLRAAALSEEVMPVFIFDPRQADPERNEYFSPRAFRFLMESLKELAIDVRARGGMLAICEGEAEGVVEDLLAREDIEAVFVGRDYTPFARAREKALADVCLGKNVVFEAVPDALLLEPEEVLKSDGKPFVVFTPFWRAARAREVSEPVLATPRNFSAHLPARHDEGAFARFFVTTPPNPAVIGGRNDGLRILRSLKNFARYGKEKDYPALSGTTRLSAHLKFGTLSVREVFHAVRRALGANHELLRQLYWRDFFTHIAWRAPRVFGANFYEKYDRIKWIRGKNDFEAWREGRTGIPIVDAGMCELRETGFMHSRVRMITASFLVKDLHIDWRWGEKLFATRLLDYDPAVNNGNWQWVAGTGVDAAPYFRIFNPWLQGKKFDPQAEYIKFWVPELRDSSPREIHGLHRSTAKRPARYPAPLVNHAKEARRALAMYRAVK